MIVGPICIRCKWDISHYDHSCKWPMLCRLCKHEVIKLSLFTRINNNFSITTTRKCRYPGCPQHVGYNISHFCPYHDISHYYSAEHMDDFQCISKFLIREDKCNNWFLTFDGFLEKQLRMLPIKNKIYNCARMGSELRHLYIIQMMSNNLYVMTSRTDNYTMVTNYIRNIYRCIKVTDNIYRFDPSDMDALIHDSQFLMYCRDGPYFGVIPTYIVQLINRFL